MKNRRINPQPTPPTKIHTSAWVILWFIVAVCAGYIIATDNANASDVWIVTPAVGQHQTVVSPSGHHHLIVTQPSHGYGYGTGQPGWNQYPNPVDSFLQNYRRGAEFNSWLRGRK